MDNLITKFYNKNIIVIKKTRLCNNYYSNYIIDLYKLFNEKSLLNNFLEYLNTFIICKNLNTPYIIGHKDICKNITTLLSYKYNYTNIIDNFNPENNIDCLLIKEHFGLSTKTLNYISQLKKKNITIKYILSIVKYRNHDHEYNNNYYMFDNYNILSTLYNFNLINLKKLLQVSNNEDTIFKSNNTIKNILENCKNKSYLIFDTSIIQNLTFKDFIKTINYLSNKIIILEINLEKFNTNEIDTIIKFVVHKNLKLIINNNPIIIKNIEFKIKDICKFNTLFIIKINIENCINLDIHTFINTEYHYIIEDTITLHDFIPVKKIIYNKIMYSQNIIGIITKDKELFYNNKLKIYRINSNETINYEKINTNNFIIIKNINHTNTVHSSTNIMLAQNNSI